MNVRAFFADTPAPAINAAPTTRNRYFIMLTRVTTASAIATQVAESDNADAVSVLRGFPSAEPPSQKRAVVGRGSSLPASRVTP